MTEPRRDRNPLVPAAVAGAATAAAAAGWLVQHRAVSKQSGPAVDPVGADLVMPADVTHHFVDADDGGRIHVVERGQGPDLVLLHGVLLSSAVWVHQLTDLAATHRVLAVDLRGHGQSLPGSDDFGFPPPPRGPSGTTRLRALARPDDGAPGIRRLATDVRQVLDALDVRDALVVGHSMGGMVALQLENDASGPELSERVSALALVSTTAGPLVPVPGWRPWAQLTGAVSSRGALIAERAGVSQLPSRDLRWWAARLGFGAEAPPAQVAFVMELLNAAPPSTFRGLVSSVAAFDLSAHLSRLDVPALVLAGTHDRLTPLRHARRLAGTLPRAELVELARCGHMPMLERRYEFSRLIDEFSAKRDRSGVDERAV
jgi:pimeloyl-ACP methyl ester carboxylesterase